MQNDWMDHLFQQSQARQNEAADKRQEEIIYWNKLVALSEPIWKQIEEKLRNRIAAFNARAKPKNKISILPPPRDYAMQFKKEGQTHTFVVTFIPGAGVINYGAPFPTAKNMGWLTVKVSEETPYLIERNLPDGKKEQVPIEAVDEVILKDYLASCLL